MKLHTLHSPPPGWLGAALEQFESQFRYPLGKGGSFSISHGRDYVTFFSAIGHATVLVAEDRGCVLATLASALRPLRFPDGQVRNVAYLGDLKVAPSARGGTVLGRMFSAMRNHLAAPSGGLGYGVVMDGTARLPSSYTGRLQVPSFKPVAQLTILCISTAATPPTDLIREVTLSDLESIRRSIAQPGFVPLGGNPNLRSCQSPRAIACPNGLVCGLLEDTHRAKQLLLDSGKKMEAVHLSRFAFANAEDGAALIRHAVHLCSQAGAPTLFVSIPASLTSSFRPLLPNLQIQEAPATVYGCGFDPSPADWWVDTAEI